MTKILVTGAGGFLGGTLVHALCQAGYGVRALVYKEGRGDEFPPGVERVMADIRDEERVKEATVGCEMIVHLAAKVHDTDTRGAAHEYEAINVEGTRNVLEGALASGARRVVFTSSVKVFGEETAGCIDETCPSAPQTPYARSKWWAEQLLSEYERKGSFTAVALRLPMVYGPTKKGNLFRMISAIDRGRFPPLPKIPAWRSMLHVGNFTQSVLLSLDRERFQRAAYIVADETPYSITAIYENLCKALGKKVPSWRVPLWVLKSAARCGDAAACVAGHTFPLTSSTLRKLVAPANYSAAAMIREMGYQPAYSFAMAIPGLIEFYRKHKAPC